MSSILSKSSENNQSMGLDLHQDFQPESRSLCENENCLGLLQENGLCNVCGQLFTKQLNRKTEVGSKPNQADEMDISNTDIQHLTFEESSQNPMSESQEFEGNERRLCKDENCIGLVENNQCKVCGLLQ